MPGVARRAAALAAAVIVLALAGVASNRLRWQADLTAGQSLTLSDQTRAVVSHIHDEVDITAFVLRADPSRAPAAALLSRYHRLNHRIAFQVLDPTEAPGEASKNDIDPAFGGLVLTMGTQSQRATSPSEQDITDALARLVRHHTATACITAGHGEPSVDDPSGPGLGTLAGLLTANGYRIRTIDLLVTPAVPPGCDALVVVNPTTGLGPAQGAVASYLASGGRAVVLNDPASTVDLSPLLAPFGMTVVHGLVLEGDDSAHLPGDPLTPVINSFPSSSPVVRNLPPVVLPTAEAVLADPAPERGLSVATIAQTTPLSFLSRHPADTRTHFDPAVDLRGPVPVGAAADRTSNTGGHVQHVRIVALGDADLASNAAIGEAGNSRLLLQAMDWLTLEDDLVSVSTHIPAYRPLALTAGRLRYLRVVTAGGVPALFLLSGAVVWAWRRRA